MGDTSYVELNTNAKGFCFVHGYCNMQEKNKRWTDNRHKLTRNCKQKQKVQQNTEETHVVDSSKTSQQNRGKQEEILKSYMLVN